MLQSINWMHILGLILLAVVLTACLRTILSVAPPATVNALRDQQPVVIDVRTTGEFNTDHVEGAVHIPLSNLEPRIGEQVTDKNRPIFLYCASGARSGSGKRILERAGYQNVHNLGSLNRARSLLASQPSSDDGTPNDD